MKKITFIILSVLIVSCDKKEEIKGESTTKEVSVTTVENQKNDYEFEITKIPVSDKDLGMFPYLNPPENYCYGSCSGWEGTINPG